MRLMMIPNVFQILLPTVLLLASCDNKAGLATADTDSDTSDNGPGVDTTANVPIEDLTTLVGTTYLVAFNPDYWHTPSNVGSEIGEYVPGFLFQFLSVDVTNNTFEAILSTANEDGTQNMCAKTGTVTGTLTDNVAFAFDPLDFEALLSGPEKTTKAPIHGLSIAGKFTDQGAGFNRGVLDALMDFRDIACIFTLLEEDDRTAETICVRMTDMGYTCETCPFDAAVSQCVTMKAELFKAAAVDFDLTPVADFDTSCYPDQSCF